MAPPKKQAAQVKDDRLMTLEELARFLHLGRKTVLKLAAASQLPGVLIEGQWRFRRADIDGWLEAQQRGTDPELFRDDEPDGMKVPLGDLLPDEALISDMRATDALAVIEELAARAYGNHWLTDKPWFIGAVVERESLASTAMEGGVAFLHTRLRDKGKIERPFIICGRSYQGIDFGAPDGKPTHLFFLLGLKYDRLHLPILGRLARAMKDAKTIARLRSLPSPSKMRALLLREDENARQESNDTRPLEYRRIEPQMDREQRLRAIMRRAAIRKHEAKKEEDQARKDEVLRLKVEAVAEKKRLAAEKRRAVAEKKKVAAEKKKAAAREKRRKIAEKKKAAVEKKRAVAAKKKALAEKKREAARTKKHRTAEKKKHALEKKKAAVAKKKLSAAKKKADAITKKASLAKKKASSAKKKASPAKKKASPAKKKAAAKKRR